ncbi:MAG: CvpA family protein [Bacteroidaceae bacterium]|nr:CvpA family protein [Bacteroidaceae bacterium]
MNTLDIIFAVVVCIGFAIGYYKGIIKQLTLGAGIIIGLLQAILFYPSLGCKLVEWTGWSEFVCNLLGGILIFAIIVSLFQLIGAIIRWFFRLILLGFADRLLGGLLSSAITVLLFVGAVSAISKIDNTNALFGQTSQENSMLYKPMRKLSVAFIEEMKKEIHEKK